MIFRNFNIIKHFKLINIRPRERKILYLFFSSFFRVFLRFKFISKIYLHYTKSIDLKNLQDFWIIRTGFTKRRNFLPYLKIDPYLFNYPDICIKPKNLPFKNESCKIIHIRHFFRYFPNNSNYSKVFKNFNKKLIPGGILKIQIKMKNNTEKIEIVKHQLNENYFYIKDINYIALKIDGTITITAIKQKFIGKIPLQVLNKKFNEIAMILNQNIQIFSEYKKICIFGFNSSDIKDYIQKKLKDKKVNSLDDIGLFYSIPDGFFDCAVLANFFEFINYEHYELIFKELRRITKPSSPLLIIIPEKKNYILKYTINVFDKGIILRVLDEFNFTIDWINLNSSFKMIQVLIRNQFENPIKKNGIKVCLIGNYTLRYSHLNSSWWDGQVRGFEKLGYETLVLDVKDNSFNYLMKSIKIFKPDILWIAGKVVIDFLKNFTEFFRSSKIKVVYWFWDVRTPKKFDFKDVIDYMFVSSIGEIDLYKKSYNLDNVYFMPALITPHILHRNRYIKEKYDIGFSGLLDNSRYHQKRTEIIKFLRKYFEVKVINNLFNNLPEFYSQCKIMFGGTPDLKHLELYSSNRLYISLSCGCCYLTNYFKGLEKIAVNEEHILWYNTKDELLEIAKKYLNDDEKRYKIKENAESLAKLNHNYTSRIINMIEIVEGKTDKFKGYIN